jgi:glycine/D-amino acid oxidase-like deaminating enzyme/nitrite reductase/ring-hydroxylating ferredoxin subunit
MKRQSEPRPLWPEAAPAVPVEHDLPKETDVVVAGAGLAGVSVALLLARRGHDVVVVDAEGLGARTTGASTAKLSLLQGTTYGTLRRRSGDDALFAYAEANRIAQQWLQDELRDIPGAQERRTAFTYATTRAGERRLREEREACAAAGLDVVARGPGDIGLPFPVDAALELPDQSQLQPAVALAALADKARSHDVRLVTGCRVSAARCLSGGVDVRTSRGRIRARRLVLATGFPVIDHGRFFAKLVASRQLVGAYRVPDPDAIPSGMYLSADRVSRSLRSALDREGEPLLIAGGDPFVTGREPDTLGRLASLDAWVADGFRGAERQQWWAAQDYGMPGGRPFFGPMPGTKGRIFAATGFNKWGMTNAVAAALAIVAHIEEAVPQWARPFAKAGPGVRGLPALLRGNAAVAREAARGWALPGWPRPVDDGGARAGVARRGTAPVATATTDGVTCELSAICPHKGGVVRWNAAERSWDCPLHGSRFSAEGRVLEGPAVEDLRRLG